MASRTFPALPAHPDVLVETDQRVWDGRFPLEVVRFRHRRFDGTLSGVKTWELWRRGHAAAVLPYDPVADVAAWRDDRPVSMRVIQEDLHHPSH